MTNTIRQIRKEWNHEYNTPRCRTCTHYKKPGTFLRNSLPVTSSPWCKLGDFRTDENALCDKWASRTGETLLADITLSRPAP